MIKKLYNWVLSWSLSPYSSWALFILAFCESSFFPIPPDVLLIALSAGMPKKSFKYALICSLGSVAGGIFGYYIGVNFMNIIGYKIISLYGFEQNIEYIKNLYIQYDAWAVAIAGFTPIPYKVFTIAAGFFKINFFVFLIASFLSRTARFFIVASLIYLFGSPIVKFIDKYFNILATLFVILLILGFFIIQIVL